MDNDNKEKIAKQLSGLSSKELENLGDIIEDLKDDGELNNSTKEKQDIRPPKEETTIQKEIIKKKGGIPKLVIIAAIIVAVIIAAVLIFSKPKESINIKTSVLLEDIKDISELASGRYTYNAVATKYDDKGEAKYYVLYDGRVDMGFDAEELEITKKNNVITIKIPQIRVVSSDIFIEPSNYIFLDASYNTETVSAEAEQLCKEDILKRASEDEDLALVAKNNAKESIEAMIEPFVSQLSSKYTIIIE